MGLVAETSGRAYRIREGGSVKSFKHCPEAYVVWYVLGLNKINKLEKL